jgi:hypothetical protein
VSYHKYINKYIIKRFLAMNSQDIYNLHEAYIGVYADLDEERAPGVKPYEPRKRNPLPKEKPLSGEKGDRSGYGDDDKMKDWKLNATPSTKDRKGRTISQRMNAEKPYKNRMMGELGRRSSRIGAEVDRVIRGKGEARATVSLAPKTKNEEVDIYDIILSHLLDEGYADTYEAAEAIMVNMSEDWRESICEEENETPIEKKSKYGRKAPAGYMQTRKPTLQQMSSREKEAWRNRGIGA